MSDTQRDIPLGKILRALADELDRNPELEARIRESVFADNKGLPAQHSTLEPNYLEDVLANSGEQELRRILNTCGIPELKSIITKLSSDPKWINQKLGEDKKHLVDFIVGTVKRRDDEKHDRLKNFPA
jgi:hypothetical protein